MLWCEAIRLDSRQEQIMDASTQSTPSRSISPLRQRMLEDMRMRKLTDKTQSQYIRAVRRFAQYLGRSPDVATAEDLRKFQLHLVNEGVSPGTLNVTITGLRFFFEVTLGNPALMVKMKSVQEPRTLPEILSREEVARLITGAENLKHQTALSVAYGAGLRAGEIVGLKVSDIDSTRMTLRVEQGKGRRDRYAMLSPSLLERLRLWWKTARAQGKMLDDGWLFPGMHPIEPLSTRQLSRAVHSAALNAGISKRVSMHSLRHAFATHLLEQKVDIRIIQVLLGHRKLGTTALYTQVATDVLREVVSPIELLPPG
jgi:integrase/recombinase XerD